MTIQDTSRVEVFVPGPLVNPLNGPRGHWAKHARWAKQWRERTHLVLLAARRVRWPMGAHEPKLVRFLASTYNTWDDDNLRAGLKPCRDSLIDAGLIHSDAPGSGHVFVYGQRIDRKQRGVRITVEPAP